MDGQRDGGPDVALGDRIPEPTGLGVIGRIGQALLREVHTVHMADDGIGLQPYRP